MLDAAGPAVPLGPAREQPQGAGPPITPFQAPSFVLQLPPNTDATQQLEGREPDRHPGQLSQVSPRSIQVRPGGHPPPADNVESQLAVQQADQTLQVQETSVAQALSDTTTSAMRNVSHAVSETVAPVAFSATMLSAGTALGAHVAADIAGQLVSEVPYVGRALEPAARMLGAMNGGAVGLHGASVLARAAPSPRAAGAALDAAAEVALDAAQQARSALEQTDLGKAISRSCSRRNSPRQPATSSSRRSRPPSPQRFNVSTPEEESSLGRAGASSQTATAGASSSAAAVPEPTTPRSTATELLLSVS